MFDKPVVCYATFAHDAFDALNVFLWNAFADIDTNAVVFANSDFLQVHADVVHIPFPRADGVILPAEAVEVASPFPDGSLGAAVLRRRACQQDGQLWVDVALHASWYLDGLGGKVDR